MRVCGNNSQSRGRMDPDIIGMSPFAPSQSVVIAAVNSLTFTPVHRASEKQHGKERPLWDVLGYGGCPVSAILIDRPPQTPDGF